MAEPLMRKNERRLLIGSILGILSSAPSAWAENFRDPTLPPTGFESRVLNPGPASNGDQQLQAILIAPGRSFATIGGQSFRVGDSLGDARIVKINESEVVLRNGKEVSRLKLFPGIEKQASSTGVVADADRRRR